MTDPPLSPDLPDDRQLAAEYVLRLLPPDQHATFEARLEAEPALRAQVAEWTTRLAGMNAEFPDIAPRTAVKSALRTRMFGTEARRRRPSLLQRLGLWQGLSFASLALAGVMAWQLAQPPAPTTPAPLYVSEITAEDQSLWLLAVYDSGTAELRLTRTDGSAPAGRVLELWGIKGDNAPVSLGVLPDAGASSVVLPEPLRGSVTDLVLAIIDEPLGGAPGGNPTGSVLALGHGDRTVTRHTTKKGGPAAHPFECLIKRRRPRTPAAAPRAPCDPARH